MAHYYYAGGERVPIERERDRVAIDLRTAQRAGLEAELEASLAAEGAKVLRGRLAVVPRSALRDDTLERLAAAGALQPVYRQDHATLVPLPEIRVELAPGQRGKALAVVGDAPYVVDVSDDLEERLVLRPRSGSGDEAIDVANFIHEKAQPVSAAVNFVRFVPRPDRAR